MFIERLQHPTIEFDAEAGQESPTLVHYFSDRAEPFKSVLPLLIEGASQDGQRVLVITSPLCELFDETIRLHRLADFADQIVIDKKQQPFFDAIKASLARAVAKLDSIEYAALDDEDD